MNIDAKWTEEYSVGNDEIDSQHKQLLWLCIIVEETYIGNKENLRIAVDMLIKYAEQHLQYEENLMAAAHYLNLVSHKAEHMKYLTELGLIVHKINTQTVTREDLSAFLSKWWINHILHTDMQYKGLV